MYIFSRFLIAHFTNTEAAEFKNKIGKQEAKDMVLKLISIIIIPFLSILLFITPAKQF